jgi:hypothetical protein
VASDHPAAFTLAGWTGRWCGSGRSRSGSAACSLVYGFRLRWPPRRVVLAVPAAVAVYAALIVLGVAVRAVV